MNNLKHKQMMSERRANRVRAKVSGTSERPRLAVSISNLHVTAQIIDDTTSKTLAYATTVGQKLTGTMTEKAAVIGEQIAKKAAKAKVSKVVLDRSSRKYHGRVKALADAARKSGLEF
ncbi:MAG TPA: 50S ribosomal protein L18 [Candidatus Saccharimonadales bacterium]|nr:50S ribosomal protein L18 [Candidatus Saccharimonadales bacterium]